MLEAVFAAAPGLDDALARETTAAVLALCAACLRARYPSGKCVSRPVVADIGTGTARTTPVVRAAASLPRMRRFIGRNLARPDLGPALPCAHFGLSRTVLYRLFQPFGAVHDDILSRRTAAAHRRLAMGPACTFSLSEIAGRSGFNDQCSFR